MVLLGMEFHNPYNISAFYIIKLGLISESKKKCKNKTKVIPYELWRCYFLQLLPGASIMEEIQLKAQDIHRARDGDQNRVFLVEIKSHLATREASNTVKLFRGKLPVCAKVSVLHRGTETKPHDPFGSFKPKPIYVPPKKGKLLQLGGGKGASSLVLLENQECQMPEGQGEQRVQ